MEINNSVNRQQLSPNFGMALCISKKAQPFIESLPAKERAYLARLGERIQGSRNDINIEEFGKVRSTYKPKASDIRLVNDGNRAAVDAERKAHQKRLDSEVTLEERVSNMISDARTLYNVAKIRLSLGKSKFMRDLKVAEEFQKADDRADAFREVLESRLNAKDAVVKQETEELMSKYGEK